MVLYVWNSAKSRPNYWVRILAAKRRKIRKIKKQIVTTQVVRSPVGCLVFILVYVHRFLTLNREPLNREPESLL